MPYIHHPELPAALAEDTVIWQYLSVGELRDLLDSSALHLTRVDHLADESIDLERQISLGARSAIPVEIMQRSLDLMHSVQTAVFISRWYASGSTMHCRWEECRTGQEQVAIRSMVKALQSALSHASQRLYLSEVQYLDFTTSLMPSGNIFLPAVHKGHELRDEKEIRLLTLQTGGQKIFSPGPSGGIDIPVDLNSMVQGIHLAARPGPRLRELVRTLAERHGLTYDSCCTQSFTPVEALHDTNFA